MRYYPENPIREALKAFTGKEPPAFVRGYDTSGLSDAENQELQYWAVDNAKPKWATGIGLIEAAELLVAEAVANGNIPPDPNEKKKKVERFVTIDDDFLEIEDKYSLKLRISFSKHVEFLRVDPSLPEDSLLGVASRAAEPFAIELFGGEKELAFETLEQAEKALEAANQALWDAFPDEGHG